MTEPRNTKRADRLALVEAGTRWNAAKLVWFYGVRHTGEKEYSDAATALLHAAEVYAVGRRRASVAFGHRFYAKQKASA